MFKALLIIQLLASLIASAVVYQQFKNVNPRPIRHALAYGFVWLWIGWLVERLKR